MSLKLPLQLDALIPADMAAKAETEGDHGSGRTRECVMIQIKLILRTFVDHASPSGQDYPFNQI